MNFFKKIDLKTDNNNWKIKTLAAYFKNQETVLDFGCGDLTLSKMLKKNYPKLKITGVDVANFPNKPKNIKFVEYDGKKLPFKNNSFDTVIAFYVFHHCDDAIASFRECARVAKKRVLFVESVYRSPIEIPFMKVMDWFYNIVKPEKVPLSYQFLTYDKWVSVFKRDRMKIERYEKIKQVFLPTFLPIGISYIFEVKKIK